ncbi:MAG: Xaa-Pro peptidase family protein [Thermoleophilia bacterium]|jgi:Xaa-Pro aminopeptidase
MIRIPIGYDSLLITHLPNVRYLTGFSGSAGCVMITRAKKLFFTDFRYQAQAKREVSGFDVHIVPAGALAGACAYAVKRRLKLGVMGFDAAHLDHRSFLEVKKVLKGTSLKDSGQVVEKSRQVKSRSEIGRIRKACALADLAMERLRRTKVTGKTEMEIAWLLESVMRKAGSGALPFEIIVASGPRSAMPHGVASGRVIRPDELVVVDLGASIDGYCSDMTRTFSTGDLSRRQSEIYHIVREAQDVALQAARPGVTCAELDGMARRHITGSGYGDAFGHSLGHGVGLEEHEGPVLAPRSKEILMAGMTVTIEPGIYVERIGGVRIEDTILVGSRGPVRLTGFTRELIRLR